MTRNYIVIKRIGLGGAFIAGFIPIFTITIVQIVAGLVSPATPSVGRIAFVPLGLLGFGLMSAVGIGSIAAVGAFIYNLIAKVAPIKIEIDITH